jgi:hypothetical protein
MERAEGAKVVVNDLGVDQVGSGGDSGPAEEVVAETIAAGGEAVASHADVADEDAVDDVISSAARAFGSL